MKKLLRWFHERLWLYSYRDMLDAREAGIRVGLQMTANIEGRAAIKLAEER